MVATWVGEVCSGDSCRRSHRHRAKQALALTSYMPRQIPLLDLDNLDAYDFNLPTWMKKTANFWTRDLISDQDFINAIEFLLDSEPERVEY